jgi:hypothetical protein
MYSAKRRFRLFRSPAFANQAFAPSSITGLNLWLDADDTTTLFQDQAGTIPLTTTGQSIGLWKDKGTSVNNAVSTVIEPVVNFTAINGKKAIVFQNNVNSFMSLTPSLLPANPTNSTYFFVLRNGNNLEDVYYGGNMWFLVNGGTQLGIRNAQGGGGYLTGSSTVTPYIVAVTITASTGVFDTFANGGTLQRQTISIGTNATTARLGSNGTGGEVYASATLLCEVLVYNRVIGTTERQILEGYLAWKWGLQANLPGGHPYKLAAP